MMLPPEILITFFSASVLLALAPGPDNIFVLAQSALHGKWSGVFVTLGLCTGLVVHTIAVALGVAVIFKTSALAFTALKLAGAAYLLYLAYMSFRAGASGTETNQQPKLGKRQLYGRGVIMNLTNPKVSIFFLAFLPQFADPARGPVSTQILLLGAIFILATIFIFGAIALMAGAIGQWFAKSPKAQIALNRVAGTVFAALALKLVTTHR